MTSLGPGRYRWRHCIDPPTHPSPALILAGIYRKRDSGRLYHRPVLRRVPPPADSFEILRHLLEPVTEDLEPSSESNYQHRAGVLFRFLMFSCGHHLNHFKGNSNYNQEFDFFQHLLQSLKQDPRTRVAVSPHRLFLRFSFFWKIPPVSSPSTCPWDFTSHLPAPLPLLDILLQDCCAGRMGIWILLTFLLGETDDSLRILRSCSEFCVSMMRARVEIYWGLMSGRGRDFYLRKYLEPRIFPGILEFPPRFFPISWCLRFKSHRAM